MRRFAVLRRIEQLDPARDFREIYRLTSTYEFPWDINQALNFALFRTYAVPGIGGLTARTGELVHRAQKRYDDTVLILDAMMMHGPTVGDGRTALRRMNRMHGSYDIDNDQLRYVLCTFVVTPIRWMDEYGWRRMCETSGSRAPTTTATSATTWASGTPRSPGRSSRATWTTTSAPASASMRAPVPSPTRRWTCWPRS